MDPSAQLSARQDPLPPRPVLPDRAAARARGPAALVEAAWKSLGLVWRWECARHEALRPGTPYPDLVGLYEAASAAPQLRRLRPFTSHFALRFSSCTDFPWDNQGGFLVPLRDGGFQVHRRDPHAVVAETRSAEEAVALAVALLPPGPGPEVTFTRRRPPASRSAGR